MAWIEILDKSLTQPEMDNNALECYSIFSTYGWSTESIAALCGNMQRESRLNPLIRAYSASGAFGLTQWTKTRKTAINEWCSSNGYNRDTGVGQCAYINHEREPGVGGWQKKSAWGRISMYDWSINTQSWTIAELTECFWACYEISGGYNPDRAKFAEHYYELFGGEPGPGPGPGPEPSLDLIYWLFRKKRKWYKPGGRQYI